MYRVELRPPAARALHASLRPAVASAVIELLHQTLRTSPLSVGKPLSSAFEGWRVVRRGEYRVIYAVDEASRTVTVIRIAHRRDAYRGAPPP